MGPIQGAVVDAGYDAGRGVSTAEAYLLALTLRIVVVVGSDHPKFMGAASHDRQ